MDFHRVPTAKDKTLFTPGPLTTSRSVKQAMLRDLGSRDEEFVTLVADLRARLLQVAGANRAHYTAIPMQGSGTFGIEAVLGSTIPPEGKLLVAINGAYGRRMVQMAQVLRIPVVAVERDEDQPVDPTAIADALHADPSITHVAVVHCETTTGIFNPITEVGQVVATAGKCYIVDAMSSFGAVPIDLAVAHIDYLVTSSNKCIEGVPGFALVLARLAHLHTIAGYARSLSMDLLAQFEGLEANGQFRFTPPIHALLAFHQALLELEAEGGVMGRAARYQQNYTDLCVGMDALGFRRYLAPQHQGYIITAFYTPDHPNFNFARFYAALSSHGHLIYPGKLSQAECFRIGHIGRIFPADVEALLAAMRSVLVEMQVDLV
jgi:2-aminoethylphosphonate-pyruvate transaminase